MRPLLQVRSKGRPHAILPNRNHRIAVFAEEIAELPEPEDKNCSKLPVVILKASNKHIIDLSNGQIVGPYNEEEQRAKPVIRSESFVYSSSCCGQGVTKSRKLCSCNQTKVSKSKILSTYISKKLQAQVGEKLCCSKRDVKTENTHGEKSSCCKGETASSDMNQLVKREPQFNMEPQLFPGVNMGNNIQNNALAQIPQTSAPNGQSGTIFTSESGKEVFEVINVPLCSIPGSCCCSSDCQCPTCEVHQNGTQNIASSTQNLDFLNNDTQFALNLILTQKNSAFPENGQYNMPFTPVTPFNFEKERMPAPQFNPAANTTPQDLYAALLQLFNSEMPDVKEPQEQVSLCTCADDSCFCQNCETHGIIEGYKLDDIFTGGVPFDLPVKLDAHT